MKCALLPLAGVVGIVLAGCSGAGSGTGTPTGLPQDHTMPGKSSSQAELYVANPTVNTVTVYPTHGSRKHRTISAGLIEPGA